MAREQFSTEREYAGRLLSVQRRPIENLNHKICLLRLEFEVFLIDQAKRKVRSLGKIACRDVVVTPGVGKDEGVAAYVQGLRVTQPDTPEGWEKCVSQRTWIKIVFDSPSSADERNPFKSVFPFNVADYAVKEYDYLIGANWVTPSVAAEEFGCSVSKLRRHVDRLENEWSDRLVRRTKGKQRRVNLRLLKNIWPRE